ncbi:MAG: dihydrofolate reductase [Oscillospiraceae bacterium]|nr:dihydrofolate reductase [Oscillospiraceae bacterium]MDY2848386.1 dihydrofolate reductase [Oscillospiraceae bacterium]
MNIIVAVGRNYGIGLNNDLIYSIPEDKKYFRSMTLGKVIVMGRKTLESMPNGKPLPKRRNVVLSRNPDYSAEDVEICHSFEELSALLKDVPDEDIFIIGGAEIYHEFLPRCNTAYITWVEGEKQADKFFPEIDKMPEWKLVSQSEEKEADGVKFCFCKYTR